MLSDQEVLAAARRSETALHEQIAQWEPLEFGVAYWASAFPHSAEANQLRDVWLADVDARSAFQRAEAFYAERGLTCRAWSPSAAQDVAPVASFLVDAGWRPMETLAMGLADSIGLSTVAATNVRILPARAMPKAFRQTFRRDEPGEEQSTELAFERLNDSSLDAFVAMVEGAPAGRIGYLQVGDIARLSDVFVLPRFRRSGVGRALAGQFMQLARRLSPRVIVACPRAEEEAGAKFLTRIGFRTVGRLTSFARPT